MRDDLLIAKISIAANIELEPPYGEGDEDFTARAVRNESHRTSHLTKRINPHEGEIIEIMMKTEKKTGKLANGVLVPECIYEEGDRLFILMITADTNLFQDAVNGDTGNFDIEQVLEDMIEALHFLHKECRIVHLDIKLENILRKNGRYYLADFGKSAPCKTTVNPVGTYMYTAPEGFKDSHGPAPVATPCEAVASLDHWSLGITLWLCAKNGVLWGAAYQSDPAFFVYACARSDLTKQNATKKSGAKRKCDCICPLAEVRCPLDEVRRHLCLDEIDQISLKVGEYVFRALALDPTKRDKDA